VKKNRYNKVNVFVTREKKMKKLMPKVEGKAIEYINKNHIYVKVVDYQNEILVLKEIIISPGQHTWFWISLSKNKPIDLKPSEHELSTFDESINKAICNPYCTVYVFEDYSDMWSSSKSLIYDDTPPTVYKSREEKEN